MEILLSLNIESFITPLASNGITADVQKETQRLATSDLNILSIAASDLKNLHSADDCRNLIWERWDELQDVTVRSTVISGNQLWGQVPQWDSLPEFSPLIFDILRLTLRSVCDMLKHQISRHLNQPIQTNSP